MGGGCWLRRCWRVCSLSSSSRVQHCQGFLTDLQALPPWQTCEWRALFKPRAAAKRKAPAIPSLDRHRSAALRYPFYVGSRSLTLRPRSVAMGRGSASSGAQLSSATPSFDRHRSAALRYQISFTLAGGGPSSSCFIETAFKNSMATSTTAPHPPPPPGIFFCRRTQSPDARARSDSDGLS